MKKVNMAITLTDLRGKEVKSQQGKKVFINETVADLLASKEAKDNTVLQRFELAQKLSNAAGDIEISDSEIELIKEVILDGRITVLLAARILQIINNIK